MTNISGAAVSGASVVWTLSQGGGSLSATNSVTNAAGQAAVDWTLGTRAGEYTVTAALSGTSSAATFRSTALAGPVVTFERISPTDQFGAIGLASEIAVAVKAADAYRNGVPGAVVSWTVTAGQEKVANPTSTTDAAGVARTTWTLGSTAGTNTLTASIPGFSPLAFSATAFVPSCPVTSVPVPIRSRTELNYSYDFRGAKTRTANLYAPEFGPNTNYCPMVVVLPGGCQDKQNIDWAGSSLAAYGYLVLTLSVQAGGTISDALEECAAAARGAIDFLTSEANPYRAFGDGAHVGAIGWSAGAEAVSGVQDVEGRLGAIVAWDNLIAYRGSPRVPALGIAAEVCSTFPQDCGDAGFSAWRAAGVPSMEVVLARSVHGSFGTFGPNDGTKPFITYYTWNWFDRWLKGDLAATTRLLADLIPSDAGGLATSRTEVLSASAASKVFLDGRDCVSLRDGCP